MQIAGTDTTATARAINLVIESRSWASAGALLSGDLGQSCLYGRNVSTSPGEGHFPTIVRSTAEWGIDPPLPFGVIEVWPVTIGDGPEEENRAVVIPLDTRLLSELQQQLISAPTIALPWNVDDDSEPFDLATIESEPVIVHRPPGLLTLDVEGVAYRIDGAVPSLTIEPNSFE